MNIFSLVDVDFDNVIRVGSELESNFFWERFGVFKKLKEVLVGLWNLILGCLVCIVYMYLLF